MSTSIPGRYASLMAPGGVCHDQRPHAEPAESSNAEDRTIGADPLVEMCTAAHDRDGHAVDVSENENTCMADGG